MALPLLLLVSLFASSFARLGSPVRRSQLLLKKIGDVKTKLDRAESRLQAIVDQEERKQDKKPMVCFTITRGVSDQAGTPAKSQLDPVGMSHLAEVSVSFSKPFECIKFCDSAFTPEHGRSGHAVHSKPGALAPVSVCRGTPGEKGQFTAGVKCITKEVFADRCPSDADRQRFAAARKVDNGNGNDSRDIATEDGEDCWYTDGGADCEHHTRGANWSGSVSESIYTM